MKNSIETTTKNPPAQLGIDKAEPASPALSSEKGAKTTEGNANPFAATQELQAIMGRARAVDDAEVAPKIAELLALGADPDATDKGFTAAMEAARKSMPLTLRILAPKSDLNAERHSGQVLGDVTALALAIHQGNEECIKILIPGSDLGWLSNGMRYDSANLIEWALTPCGSPHKQIWMFKSLATAGMANGRLVPDSDQWAQGAKIAIEADDVDFLKMCGEHVDLGALACPEKDSESELTHPKSEPLHPNLAFFAAVKRAPLALAHLLEIGVSPAAPGEGRMTALMVAAGSGHPHGPVSLACMKILMDHPDGAVDARTENGATALITVAHLGHEEAVALLAQKTNPDTQTTAGRTALMAAIMGQRLKVVKILAPITNLSLKTTDGRTALDLAMAADGEARGTRFALTNALICALPPAQAAEMGQRMLTRLLPDYLPLAEAHALRQQIDAVSPGRGVGEKKADTLAEGSEAGESARGDDGFLGESRGRKIPRI